MVLKLVTDCFWCEITLSLSLNSGFIYGMKKKSIKLILNLSKL